MVGSGGAYDIIDRDGKTSQIEIAIVGQETRKRKQGFWLEITWGTARSGGELLMKYLVAPGENGGVSTRIIMQQPGQLPIEFVSNGSVPAVDGVAAQMPPPDIRDKADDLGAETITVPAGTFNCEHYRNRDDSADVWISEKVGPWGLVKIVGKDSTVVLSRVISDARDRVTGTPKKIDPTQMMRNGSASRSAGRR